MTAAALPDNARDTAAACDVAVVGGGPAGMSAAIDAAALGLDVVLIDEQPGPGGQIYRAITTTPVRDRGILGADYWRGEALAATFMRCGARPLFDTTLWAVERNVDGFALAVSNNGAARLIKAAHVILATGAQERPFPIPGWTLPGVMAAGAAQILLKSAGLVPDGPVVVAGCGPLLYLIVAQFHAAGVALECVLDTTPPGRWRQSRRMLAEFVRSPYFVKGWSMLRRAKSRTRIVSGVTQLRAQGAGRLENVGWSCAEQHGSVPAGLLLLHQGVIPGINLSRALGCAHHWDEAQCCFVPTVDTWGASSLPGITIAGDAAGIAGARAAEARGSLAAFQAAYALGSLTLEQRDARGHASHHRSDGNGDSPLRALRRFSLGRAFLDEYFKPPRQFRIPTGDTVVCRCEEVTAQQIVDAVSLGCTGPNQLKAFLRAGMGPCQGRMCGTTVAEIIAHERGLSPAETGYYRLRFPTKPVTLAELASMPKTEAAIAAVVRK